MEIKILEFAEGARAATGVTVVIDVFRAFSVACYAFESGALRVLASPGIEESFNLRNKFRNCVLAGERNEKKIHGFDFGNSPTEIIKENLTGKTFIFTTTAGTNGLMNANGSDILLTGSLINACAVGDYISSLQPDQVSLVAMGYRGKISADEDLLCAKIISDRIRGVNGTYNEEISSLKNGAGKRFFDPSNIDFSPPTDFFLCTMLDRFNFVLKAERRPDGSIELFRLESLGS